MVSRIVEQHENEFSTLESLVEVLKPLSVFTEALSGENHVTVSALRPLLSHLLTNLLHVEPLLKSAVL